MAIHTSEFAVVQPKALPQGTPEYERRRASILETFASKVPVKLRLPADFFSNPPKDVSNVPKTCGILTPAEIDITENYDAVGLAEAIAARKLSAVEVATAFSKRAIIAHQLTCCLTQWFMEDAIKKAQELDDYQQKTGKTVGPLHGVPISIKEHIPVTGTYSSAGSLASTLFDEKDCLLVSMLRSMGAVFYCKTNQPQTIMHLETTSHYGRTLNPFNTDLSAGGSSGGEAALVAMKASVLGVGTDIGGSIRGPAAFCGVYGYKSTSYMLPMRDFLSHSFSAELNVLCSTGPFCRSLRDMDLFMTTVLGQKPWLQDQKVIPLPWTGLQSPAHKPLRIGIIENDGFIEPQPPVKRAIAWARSQLSDPKHSSIFQVKPYTPYKAAEAWKKIRRMYWPSGGKLAKEDIMSTGEPVLPLSEWAWKDAEPHGMLDAEQVNELRADRDKFRHEFADHWNAQEVDVVIGPAFVGPASAHDTAFYWTYTSLYNFVDYPGVIMPTPVEAEAKEEYAKDYKPLSEECRHVKELWESSKFEGAPISLQVCARRYHDNELFGALAMLKDALELP
ncbi:general amidase [Stemphylium lycopersici]|uniref:amidase n=1 Tax=Stemphylium lycopersici TaxID=183478 RepID=A0A364NFP6_STELY|nr:general amidase [Stemphylium lycopersici]RAR03703.1 general amidase [Stemphylium lycopersici]RAR16128.1 general amidase [Stemphylium lycopersici]